MPYTKGEQHNHTYETQILSTTPHSHFSSDTITVCLSQEFLTLNLLNNIPSKPTMQWHMFKKKKKAVPQASGCFPAPPPQNLETAN